MSVSQACSLGAPRKVEVGVLKSSSMAALLQSLHHRAMHWLLRTLCKYTD